MTEAIEGSVVLITGASGAIAQALIAALTARGAARIYAAARDVSGLAASSHLVPIKMDVTSDEDVTSAAAVATDVTLLINQCRRQPQYRLPGRSRSGDRAGGNRGQLSRAAARDAGLRAGADRQSRRGAQPVDDSGAGEPAVHGFLLRLQGRRPQPDPGIARRPDAERRSRRRGVAPARSTRG